MRAGQNAEAAEQSNRWFSRFKTIVHLMTPGRYNFFLLAMFAQRNRRLIRAFCFHAPYLWTDALRSRGEAPALFVQLAAHGVIAGIPSEAEATRLDVPTLRRKLLRYDAPAPTTAKDGPAQRAGGSTMQMA